MRKEGGLVLEGTIRDEAGKPVPEAFVVVHRRDMGEDFVTAYSDAQGHYQIQGLGDGEFVVHVDAVHRGLVRTRTPLDLDKTSKTTRLDFTLARGVLISGKFVDQQGHDWKVAISTGRAIAEPSQGRRGSESSEASPRRTRISATNTGPRITTGWPAAHSAWAAAITPMARWFSPPGAPSSFKG